MNYTTAIFLANPAVRAVAVSYEVTADGKGVAPFKTYKTLDQSLRVGDYVVTPTDTRHKMTVCRVERVDLDIDVESPVELSWIIGRVDTAAHDQVVAQEETAIAAIKSAERRHQREELARKLMADNPAFASLQGVGGGTLPPPPAPAPYDDIQEAPAARAYEPGDGGEQIDF